MPKLSDCVLNFVFHGQYFKWIQKYSNNKGEASRVSQNLEQCGTATKILQQTNREEPDRCLYTKKTEYNRPLLYISKY